MTRNTKHPHEFPLIRNFEEEHGHRWRPFCIVTDCFVGYDQTWAYCDEPDLYYLADEQRD